MGKISEALNKASSLQPDLNREEESVRQKTVPEPPKEELTRPSISRKPIPEKSSQKQFNIAPVNEWEERVRLATVPSSPFAESFRKLRTTILHPAQGTAPRTVLITSAVPHEGKGFVTANLGVSIAQSAEIKCTMIDCDLRRSSLSLLFGKATNRKGLSNYLRGEIPWPDVITPTAQKGLSLLPSGPSLEDPSTLIDSSRMFDLMGELSKIPYELFLIDSPPIHAAAETAVLAKMVDKVLIVVRWGTAGRQQVADLVETVGRDKIIGIVFNAFEQNALDSIFEKKGYYGYYGYYGKGY